MREKNHSFLCISSLSPVRFSRPVCPLARPLPAPCPPLARPLPAYAGAVPLLYVHARCWKWAREGLPLAPPSAAGKRACVCTAFTRGC